MVGACEYLVMCGYFVYLFILDVFIYFFIFYYYYFFYVTNIYIEYLHNYVW